MLSREEYLGIIPYDVFNGHIRYDHEITMEAPGKITHKTDDYKVTITFDTHLKSYQYTDRDKAIRVEYENGEVRRYTKMIYDNDVFILSILTSNGTYTNPLTGPECLSTYEYKVKGDVNTKFGIIIDCQGELKWM